MAVKNEARPAVESKRATDLTINNSLARAVKYDMARDDPETWERGCRGAGAMLCIVLAIGVLISCID